MSTDPILPGINGVLFVLIVCIWFGLVLWGILSVLRNRLLSVGQRVTWIVCILFFPLLGPLARFLNSRAAPPLGHD